MVTMVTSVDIFQSVLRAHWYNSRGTNHSVNVHEIEITALRELDWLITKYKYQSVTPLTDKPVLPISGVAFWQIAICYCDVIGTSCNTRSICVKTKNTNCDTI